MTVDVTIESDDRLHRKVWGFVFYGYGKVKTVRYLSYAEYERETKRHKYRMTARYDRPNSQKFRGNSLGAIPPLDNAEERIIDTLRKNVVMEAE